MADETTRPLELWTDAALEEMRVLVMGEQQYRRTIGEAASFAEQVSRQVTEAMHLTDGGPWVEREYVGYPRNWRATHNAKVWRSLTPNNMEEPGVSGWREEATGEMPADFLKPARRRDAYKRGERVTFAGRAYTANRGGVMDSPAEAPASWTLEGAPAPIGPPTLPPVAAGPK